jgi:tRNA acetyltransferase TAN1
MLRNFNILATTFRGNEDDACSELWYLLTEVGDPAPTVDRTEVSGLIIGKTVGNPFEVVDELRRILRKRPYEFRYMLRIVPIAKVLSTDLGEIGRVATMLSSKIGRDETFRVTVEKRFADIHSREIVEAAAANVERKVDLTNPDKILLIEVIGGVTGISVIRPNDIISVMKEKAL